MKIAKRIPRGRHLLKWEDLHLLIVKDKRGVTISVVQGALPQSIETVEMVPRFREKRRERE